MRKPFYHGKGGNLPNPAPGGIPWILSIALWTVAGGALGGLAVLLLGRKDLSLGLFAGSLLSTLNFLALRVLAGKVLLSGEARGKKFFWSCNTARWLLLTLAFLLCFKVSQACLLGALAGYFWFLLVLGWVGWRSASASKIS